MSQLKMERDDEQESEEETASEEAEEWYNQFAEEGLVDDQDYEQSLGFFWGEDSDSEEAEFDFDLQSECAL